MSVSKRGKNMVDYTAEDLRRAYEEVGVRRGMTVLLKTDLLKLGYFESRKKEDILEAHFRVLSDLVDLNKGTIVVSTSSTYLCNTKEPFDPRTTKSERGVLTEYIRTREGAVRSFHPFTSYAAIGREAREMCSDVSRHAYGPQTPKARLLERETLCVSMGLPPRLTTSLVHHVEMIMGVPYRYTKEFIHPVVRGQDIAEEPFYLFVYYRECAIKRNRNVKIFERFLQKGHRIAESKLGKGLLYAYSLNDFYRWTIEAFKEDIYIWLDEPPRVRPYQK